MWAAVNQEHEHVVMLKKKKKIGVNKNFFFLEALEVGMGGG